MAKSKTISEDELATFLKNGLTTTEIAKIKNLNPRTVGYYYKIYKLKHNPKQDERKYNVNDYFLNDVKEEQAYFLGLMASDGYIVKFKKCLTQPYRAFSLSQSGEHGLELINYIRDLLKSNCKIHYNAKVNSHTIQISSKILTSKLIEFGITPRKTLTLQFPKQITDDLIAPFMRGYIDGDGCVGIYKRGAGEYLNISFVGTKDFIDYVVPIIPAKGSINKIKKCKNLYQVGYNGFAAEQIGEWLYKNPNLYCGKKRATYKRYLTDFNPPYRLNKSKRVYQIIKAKELYDANVPVAKIAKTIGVCFQTIYTWKKDFKW